MVKTKIKNTIINKKKLDSNKHKHKYSKIHRGGAKALVKTKEEEEIEEIKKLAKDKGFEYIKIKDDGWCYYYAILQGISDNPNIKNTKEDAEKLANLIVKWFIKNEDTPYNFIANMTLKNYIESQEWIINPETTSGGQETKKIKFNDFLKNIVKSQKSISEDKNGFKNPGPLIWADYITFSQAVADINNINIKLYEIKNNEILLKEKFLEFKPSVDVGSKTINLIIVGNPQNHFDLLIPIIKTPSPEILETDIQEYSSLLINNMKDVKDYDEMMDHTLNLPNHLLKIPFFVHYNNISYYQKIDSVDFKHNNNEKILKSCYFDLKENGNEERIYLIRQKILPYDENEKGRKIDFLPDPFYMKNNEIKKKFDDATWKAFTRINFNGNLKIFNLKIKKNVEKDINVYCHGDKFSGSLSNIDIFNDLDIDKDKLGDNNFFYYVEFTPDITTITYPPIENMPRTKENFPIFKGFYWISYMDNIPETFDPIPDLEPNLCDVMEKKFKELLSIKEPIKDPIKEPIKDPIKKSSTFKSPAITTKLYSPKISFCYN